MKPITNADRRRIIYKFYRDQGYSRKEAQNLRGRWTSVWFDYNERVKEVRAFGGTPPRAPKLPLTKTTKKNIRKKLIKKGLSKRIAGQWVNLRPDRLFNRIDNLDKYFETIHKELRKTKTKKQADQIVKKLIKNIGKYRTNSLLFEMLGEFYDITMGI